MQHHKLVRDRIPALIMAKGETPIYHRLADEEFALALRRKLHEEVAEFEGTRATDELADILEVVYALAQHSGISPAALEGLRQQKQAERGGFEERWFLVETRVS